MKEILGIEGLIKRYKNSESVVLNGLSLSILEGDIYGFIGPNGAGKTTTIKIISGLVPYENGKISVFGKSLHENHSYIKQNIGIVPQDIALFPTLSGYENLIVFGGIYGIEKIKLKERINDLLQLFGLEKHKDKKVETYSGGMKRRINLIAGILHNPKLLLLDEPTVGIDVQSKNVILENLRKLNALGTTILYTSHDMDEAQQFCTKIGIIDEGKIIVESCPQTLIETYQDCNNLESVYLLLTGKKLRD